MQHEHGQGQGHGHAAWTQTCSMDTNMQHRHKHSAWTRTCSMNKDMGMHQDMDILDIQHDQGPLARI